MDNVILYSTGCPKCKILCKVMTENHIPFVENNSVEDMQALGFTEAPKLSVNGTIYNFTDALKWARQNGG